MHWIPTVAAELARMKLENDALLACCSSAEEKEKVVLAEQERMTLPSLADKEKVNQLQKALHKLGEDLQRTQDIVLHQHELGFNKGLEHVVFFYGIPLTEGKFNVNKDFYKGELMPVTNIPDRGAGQPAVPVPLMMPARAEPCLIRPRFAHAFFDIANVGDLFFDNWSPFSGFISFWKFM
ncbi:hypothetical protein ACSQ67_010301 [Phaseolus vulgaris]